MLSAPFIEVLTRLDFPGVILLAVDGQGRVLGVNRHGCELLGKTDAALQGQPWQESFVAPGAREDAQRRFETALAGRTAFEAPMVTRTGQRRVITWRPAGAAGGPIICIGEDVTTRAKAQADLAASESKMHAVVENAVEGIITITERGIIQTANRAACRIFGYSAEEMIGRNVNMLMPSPDREQHDGYLRRYLETGMAGIIGKGREVIALRKNGERFPIYLSVSDIIADAHIFTGVVRDLTEEKRMHRRMVEQEALATLGRMASVVAHEVKNPLAGIAGVIQILRSRASESSEDWQIMGDVLARIDALVETIQDMLLYARPRELRRAPVRLSALLAESARLVGKDANLREVNVIVPESELELELDADYLREAVLNLFINAAQAMGGKGKVLTEVIDGGDHALIRVCDEGPGIPQAIRAKVFEPFFTTKGRGTGLGLSLVKSVVERHGGQIDIACPQSGGTVVTLRLPKGAPAAK